MSDRQTLVLLDAHAIIHRAYHALPEFTNSEGEPTGALYGIVAMLINILTELKPDYIAACFDLPKPTHRHELYDGYKGTRKHAEDDLVAQIERSRDLFTTFNIPIYEAAGYEADDVLGTIVEKLKDTPLNIIIASGDMDTLQLVDDDTVRVYTLKKGIKDTVLYNEDAVRERFHFGPEFLPDYKGLRGDPSDNIPGVQGIGEKAATIAVTQFGGLDALYAALEQHDDEHFKKLGLSLRMVTLLREGKDEAYFSRLLATIKRDAPITFTLPEQSWRESVDGAAVGVLIQELEFRSLMPRVQQLLGVPDVSSAPAGQAQAEEPTGEELQEVAVMLWLVKSDITNPTYDDVMQFTGARTFAQAQEILQQLLAERGLTQVYEQIEKPLIPIITRMNEAGILLDVPYLTQLSAEYHAEVNRLEKEIFALADTEFNIKSPRQLGEVLFDKLGLKGGKKTAGGQRSTKESELEKLRGEHPIVEKIFEYRELQKLLSTYVDNLPKMVDADGRLHTQFIQTGTTTGRMASQQPNLQNIPTKSEAGRRVRGGFVAAPGHVLVALDYSQIELRIAAALSGDEKLTAIFKSGGDIHTAVAAEVFRVGLQEVTPEMRRRAKVINFGILYGMGVNALRANLQEGLPAQAGGDVVTQKDAKTYLETYFATFSGLAAWIDKTKAEAARLGYTTTKFGRKRHFEGLTSHIPYVRAAAERMAVNAPIQGTQSDIMKLAMIEADEYLAAHNLRKSVRLILQVHDELVYEMVEDEWEEYARAIKEIMEHVDDLPLPLSAAVKVGVRWNALEQVAL